MMDKYQALVDEIDTQIRELEETLQAIAPTHVEYAAISEDLRVAKQHWENAKAELAKL